MTGRTAETSLSSQERRVRIELLRLRAGYQRLEAHRTACRLLGELQPRALAAQARDGLQSIGLGWLGHGLKTLRRLPVLLPLASTLLSGTRRRRLLLKAALIGGLVWAGKHRSENHQRNDRS